MDFCVNCELCPSRESKVEGFSLHCIFSVFLDYILYKYFTDSNIIYHIQSIHLAYSNNPNPNSVFLYLFLL